jgi:DNA (cytosine-5)-methyltransferase 1
VGEAAEPFIVTLRQHGEGRSIAEPMPTITAGGEHQAVALPFMVNYHGGTDPDRDGTERSCGVDQPIPVIPTENRYGLCVPFQFKAIGRSPGLTKGIDEPVSTIVAARENHSIVVPYLLPRTGIYDSKETLKRPQGVDEPIPTVIASHGAGHVVMPFMQTLTHGGRERSLNEPFPTITTAHRGEHAITMPFLTKYNGTGGAVSVDEPLHTVTTKDRCGLAMVSLLQTMKELNVVDIGFRMLDVDELARAQGFPEGYILHGTKAEQVRQVGNAVCPPVARALCETIAEAC